MDAITAKMFRTVHGTVKKETYDKLRWLSYKHDFPVDATIGQMIEKCMAQIDFSDYQPLE